MKPSRPDAVATGSETISDDLKSAALRDVLGSAEFTTSPRLCEFLQYIVQEQLAGRAEGIKGKTIAADVYGRDITNGSSGHNIVRVEARRLRRLLDEYYAGTGHADEVRIHIDPGGYVPRFEEAVERSISEPATEKSAAPHLTASDARQFARKRAGLWLGIGLVSLLGAMAIGSLVLKTETNNPASSVIAQSAARAALRQHSIEALQASDIAAEARALYFPVFDARRQKIALDMFGYAMELAPDLPDGYAGTAQVLATLHMITPDQDQRVAYLAGAKQAAATALDLSPTMAWSVASQAWVLAQDGEVEDALRKARLALELAPEDGHVLDLVGVTAIFVNDPGLAMEVSAPERNRQGVRPVGTQNIWGLSNLMAGNDTVTIAAFGKAAGQGAVVSAPSLIFQAVSHDRMGDESEARRLAEELRKTWPDFPVQFLVGRIFQNNQALEDEIITRMSRLQ